MALFTHRKAVYALLRQLGDTSSLSVPWTDVLLLKLCRLIVLVSTGYAYTSPLTQLLDAQALWAVRQLPRTYYVGLNSPTYIELATGDLKDLSPAIYSTYASPGMRKLALQLVFGAYILRPSMTGDVEPSR